MVFLLFTAFSSQLIAGNDRSLVTFNLKISWIFYFYFSSSSSSSVFQVICFVILDSFSVFDIL